MTNLYLEFSEITRDISASLRHLSDLGCRGADCADETLALVRSWDMAALLMDLQRCRRCRLATGRKRVVSGRGNLRATIVFVGGIPEPEDEETGRSYSGPAGELLGRIIGAMKLDAESVYITHAVKCRPESDADIGPNHIIGQACRHHLMAELVHVRPKIICALGDLAAGSLSDSNAPVSRLRGRFLPFKNSRVMVTFSPEHILAHPSAKRVVWEDVKKIMAALAGQ
jgi:uracil-DNA glycosylase